MKRWLLPTSIVLMVASVGTLLFLLFGQTKPDTSNITQGDQKTESAASSETKEEDPLKPSEIFKKEFKDLSATEVELPKQLVIPKHDIKAKVEQVGLDKDGADGNTEKRTTSRLVQVRSTSR